MSIPMPNMRTSHKALAPTSRRNNVLNVRTRESPQHRSPHSSDLGHQALLAPSPDRDPLERGEAEVLDRQSDQHHHRKAREHAVRVELVAVLEDVPAEAAMAGGGAETSSAAISVRHAKAQPILSPERIEGSAAGARICST